MTQIYVQNPPRWREHYFILCGNAVRSNPFGRRKWCNHCNVVDIQHELKIGKQQNIPNMHLRFMHKLSSVWEVVLDVCVFFAVVFVWFIYTYAKVCVMVYKEHIDTKDIISVCINQNVQYTYSFNTKLSRIKNRVNFK